MVISRLTVQHGAQLAFLLFSKGGRAVANDETETISGPRRDTLVILSGSSTLARDDLYTPKINTTKTDRCLELGPWWAPPVAFVACPFEAVEAGQWIWDFPRASKAQRLPRSRPDAGLGTQGAELVLRGTRCPS